MDRQSQSAKASAGELISGESRELTAYLPKGEQIEKVSFANRQTAANKILEVLDKLEPLVAPGGRDPYECRSLFYVIKMGVTQVADGTIPSLNYGMADKVINLQDRLREANKRLGSSTNYHWVVQAYNETNQAIEMFLGLDAINVLLVSYEP